MIEQPLTVDEFMELVEDELADQVDAMIRAERDPETRRAMHAQRTSILEQVRKHTRRVNQNAAALRCHRMKMN